ncbi:MAG: FYVE zinc finger domain-containing protein [Syntrophaceae bacterium]
MDKDFHYYATFAAAKLAGWDEKKAQTIAYAAQFVDDFDYNYGYGGEPWYIKYKNKNNLELPHTGTLRFEKAAEHIFKVSPRRTAQNDKSDFVLDKHVRRDIWVPFHFLPGNFIPKGKDTVPGYIQRKVAKLPHADFKLLARPMSPLAIDMINDLLNLDHDEPYFLHLLGLRMHVFADTWAHQDFVGDGIKAINDCAGWYNFYEAEPSIMKQVDWQVLSTELEYAPPIFIFQSYLGHGRLGHFPDFGWCRYYYTPAWLQQEGKFMIGRDNPREFEKAFFEMVKVMWAAKNGKKKYPLGTNEGPEMKAQVRENIQLAICLDQARFFKIKKGGSFKESEGMWKDVMAQTEGIGKIPKDYDKTEWRKAAEKDGSLTKDKGYHWNNGDAFEDSNIYRFNLAAEHQFAFIQEKLREYLGYELRPWDRESKLPLGTRWVPDTEANVCSHCTKQFSTLVRRHHCRRCGKVFCDACTSSRAVIPGSDYKKPQRICRACLSVISKKI